MSIVIASVVAAVAGLGVRNIIGYLRATDTEPFDIKKSLASGIIGFLVGIPLIITAFEGAFGELESLPETTQLAIFASQVLIISGIDAVTKGGFKAATKSALKATKTKK